jgi:hypothetical protein
MRFFPLDEENKLKLRKLFIALLASIVLLDDCDDLQYIRHRIKHQKLLASIVLLDDCDRKNP